MLPVISASAPGVPLAQHTELPIGTTDEGRGMPEADTTRSPAALTLELKITVGAALG